jgi:serine/threonine-protein kinase HipA
MRQAAIHIKQRFAGILTETDSGYSFLYDNAYLSEETAEPVSLTMPLRKEPYTDKVLFPFFDGLIPEGWLLDIAERNWKINHRDRMALLLSCCRDCIGAVSVTSINNE